MKIETQMQFRPGGRDLLAMALGVSLAVVIVGCGALGTGIIPLSSGVQVAAAGTQMV